jgi:hypothetical protein
LDNDQFDLQIRSDRNRGMLGMAAVKDLQGNRHVVISRKSDNAGTHAELALLQGIAEHFKGTGIRLNAAKIVEDPSRSHRHPRLSFRRTPGGHVPRLHKQ